MQQPNPKSGGRLSRTVLQAFLAIFAVTNFFTLILNAFAACKYGKVLSTYFLDPEIRNHRATSVAIYFDENNNIVGNPRRFLLSSRLPFLFLAFISCIAWIITALTVLFLFTKIRHFNHRVARYVFKITAAITFILLVVFYFSWVSTYSFQFPFAAHWGAGSAAVVFAHLNLLIGIFITLLAAVLDTPKDDQPEPPTGPNSRRTTQP
ncbi:uncharacterized protein FTOL_11709 [Fusarium torulosum]|uniref:Uncharacterized protein n=1 Tax=Fusarium torulosum TaxID=33205 RepID=A0AAE8MJ93_9HYPO|nr:uncharacterized protein FTOL_11709 [Fusarium torulosum]